MEKAELTSGEEADDRRRAAGLVPLSLLSLCFHFGSLVYPVSESLPELALSEADSLVVELVVWLEDTVTVGMGCEGVRWGRGTGEASCVADVGNWRNFSPRGESGVCTDWSAMLLASDSLEDLRLRSNSSESSGNRRFSLPTGNLPSP